MLEDKKASFAFLVLTYNHQNYILEHLESIKYLVITHGHNIDIDLIINDDGSKDETCSLVSRWLSYNKYLFRAVTTLFNPTNLGTCRSVDNMLAKVNADRCKITAGDDVYSFENIFELTKHSSETAMISGRVLLLFGDQIEEDRVTDLLITSTQAIYEKNSLIHRFKHFSYNNAPNLLYSTECLLDSRVRDYLRRYDVVEDWPLQIAIAREFPKRRYELIEEVLVYYRRTLGSTYLVANKRFLKDKIEIYKDLIKTERNPIERLRLRSRLACFEINNRILKNLLNLDFYMFVSSCVFNFAKILRRNKTQTKLKEHRLHYEKIKRCSEQFLSNSA